MKKKMKNYKGEDDDNIPICRENRIEGVLKISWENDLSCLPNNRFS